MTRITNRTRARLGTALAALALGLGSVTAAVPAIAQPAGAARPTQMMDLSINEGKLVRLPAPMSDLFIANDSIADVQVRSPTQLYIFGKSRGNTTVYATDRSGRVVYSTNVNVAYNLGSVDSMLNLAMPEAAITATPVGNMVLLTGTVPSPEDANEAARLVMAFVGDGVQVVNRLKSAVPLQVNLRVRIAEVNRSVSKQIGINLLSQDATSGFQFGVAQGNAGTFGTPACGTCGTAAVPKGFNALAGATSLGAAGKLFGLDLIGTLDLAAKDGLVTILAEPNLTALSGETASFLAGGEFPVPISQSLGAITIEYKQYGVGLAFTPYVLADGRISMRVRPEVSELSNEGTIRLNGFNVPALTTRRAETTVELGSGQSFMIAGLLRDSHTNDVTKAPFLGDLPILGALFRSTSFRRAETELVIIVTPYLVRPVSNQMALPTDGYRMPTDAQGLVGGQAYTGTSGPRPATPASAPAPGMSAGAAATAAPGFKL
jgi:pilus assembly protein CpaC